MDTLLFSKVKDPNLSNIIYGYLHDPINSCIRKQLRKMPTTIRVMCVVCGNFKKDCHCLRHSQLQFEMRMKRTAAYCFGCPGSILIESEFEQVCPICGLATY
jgi:hypothetical protein